MITSRVFFFAMLVWVCAAVEERDARGWFDRSTHTITRMVTERVLATEYMPSSCVVVQTSLPPCRHLRAVDEIQPTQPVRIMQTSAPPRTPGRDQQGWRPIIHPSSGAVPSGSRVHMKPTPLIGRDSNPNATEAPSTFWNNWNLFNFRPKEVTVTATVRETLTTRYLDPNTVVTFSVKGCKPTKLPFDLPHCNPPKATIETSTSVLMKASEEPGLIVMAPIQLVPNMAPIIMPDMRGAVPIEEKPAHLGQEENKDEVKKNETLKND